MKVGVNTNEFNLQQGSSNFLSSDPLDYTFIPHQPLLISTIKTQMQLLLIFFNIYAGLTALTAQSCLQSSKF